MLRTTYSYLNHWYKCHERKMPTPVSHGVNPQPISLKYGQVEPFSKDLDWRFLSQDQKYRSDPIRRARIAEPDSGLPLFALRATFARRLEAQKARYPLMAVISKMPP
jgi:hypothetical protein